jgi:hypothetical protein
MTRAPIRAWGTIILLAGCQGAPGDAVEVTDQAIINGAPLTNSAAASSGVVMLERPGGSGILLDSRWVLTAKHAFAPATDPDADGDGWVDDPGKTEVTFGNLADASRARRTADAILLHPTLDVALVHLALAAPGTVPTNHFTNGHLALYGGTNASLQGKTTTAMGYGMIIPGPASPAVGFGTLRTSRLPITSSNPSTLNTSTATTDGQTNHGDSGGPRYYDLFNSDGSLKARFLAGVTVNTGAGDDNTLSISVGVEAFRAWVDDVVWGRLKTTIRAHSGFSNPGNMIDDNIATKSDLAKTQGTVDLDLEDKFTITRVAVAEDHAGSTSVGRYALQCWTGSAWGPQMFNVTTTVGTPRVNEKTLSTTCTSNRVRVTLANSGNVEVYGIEIYGKPAGTRALTLAASPSPRCGGNGIPAPGVYTVTPGPGPMICANSCRSYVFEGWQVTPGIRLANLLDNCTSVLDLRASGTVTARFHPAHVFLNVDSGPNGTIVEQGSFSINYGDSFTIHATPDTGFRVGGYTFPDPGTEIPYTTSNDVVIANIKQDGNVHVEFEIPWVGLDVATPDGNGQISPRDKVKVTIGADQLFTMTPAPGYRMARICGSRWPEDCLPWTENQYTFPGATAEDFSLYPEFEPVIPPRLAGLTVAGSSGFVNGGLLVDRDSTTRGTDSKTDAWVDLKLDGRYRLTKLEVGEDSAGNAEVKSYDLQCWNGTVLGPSLFTTDSPFALPAMNEHVIPGNNTCVTDRVRVNFHNPTGSIEVYEVRVSGMLN